MSYRKDLDEYTDDQLQAELTMRRSRRAEGRCDYCNRRYDASPCRFPERHAKAGLGAEKSKEG